MPVLINRVGGFEPNAAPPRQQRETLLHMFLELTLVIQLARSDDDPEISRFGKSPFEKSVDLGPVTPLHRG